MKKITHWQLIFALFLGFSISTMGQEVLLNGNFEAWDDATHPTSWTKVENIDQESGAGLVHGGTYSAKHTGGTKDLGQTITGIVAGESYTLTMWYKVVESDGTDARIWSYWKNSGTNINDNGAELRGPNSSYLDNNGGAWTEYTVTLNAPATANEFYFEVRTYGSAVTYWDDFSFFKNAASSVPAPVFDPIAGTYTEAQTVTMATPSKTSFDIYYTTDGTDPDNTDNLYSAPINVATTTTFKAVTFDGTDYSQVTTAAYEIIIPVEVATIAELRTQATGSQIYILTGQAILTFQQSYRGQKYIQDATAAVLIDDNSGNITTTYNIGDGITGITGTLGEYGGMLQFVPTEDPGAATSTGNTFNPQEITLADFNDNFEDYESELVKVLGVTFTDGGGTFANGQAYEITDGSSTNKATSNFRTTFYDVDYIGETIPTDPQDIICIANSRNDGNYLSSRVAADIVAAPIPPVPVKSAGIIIAGLLIGLVVVVRKGRLF